MFQYYHWSQFYLIMANYTVGFLAQANYTVGFLAQDHKDVYCKNECTGKGKRL